MSLRPSDIPERVVRELEQGTRQTSNLAEALAIDFAKLARNTVPQLPAASITQLQRAKPLGITKRMLLAAQLVTDALGKGAVNTLAAHPSDTLRGWACYAVGFEADRSLSKRFNAIRPLADDPHFGVREWAWLGLRSHIVSEPQRAIELLESWTASDSAYLRRYAVEATRPRGVWAAHIPLLKASPELALPLLEPLRSDPSVYVQDSVANWLNDAAKTQPQWVRSLVDRWTADPGVTDATARIARRAVRSLS